MSCCSLPSHGREIYNTVQLVGSALLITENRYFRTAILELLEVNVFTSILSSQITFYKGSADWNQSRYNKFLQANDTYANKRTTLLL